MPGVISPALDWTLAREQRGAAVTEKQHV